MNVLHTKGAKMGEVIDMQGYLERKAAETQPDSIQRRLAEIALEMLLLQSEKNRLERQLLNPDQ